MSNNQWVSNNQYEYSFSTLCQKKKLRRHDFYCHYAKPNAETMPEYHPLLCIQNMVNNLVKMSNFSC